MESFQVIQPRALLSPYVKNYWFLHGGASDIPQRIIPSGCVSLVFHRSGRMFSEEKNDLQPSSFLCGQSSGYDELRQTGEVDMIHLTFRPSGARAFFGMPLLQTLNLNIPVDALSDKPLQELEARLFETSDTGEAVRMIEEYLFRRLAVSKEYNIDRMDAVVRAIDAGVSDISNLADISCLGYKQFKRIFSDYIGMNPKDFIRVVRFHRTLHTKRNHPDMSLARLAVECGCYDQSHLTREFKSFSGYTPLEYFSICDPYSDYFG